MWCWVNIKIASSIIWKLFWIKYKKSSKNKSFGIKKIRSINWVSRLNKNIFLQRGSFSFHFISSVGKLHWVFIYRILSICKLNSDSSKHVSRHNSACKSNHEHICKWICSVLSLLSEFNQTHSLLIINF